MNAVRPQKLFSLTLAHDRWESAVGRPRDIAHQVRAGHCGMPQRAGGRAAARATYAAIQQLNDGPPEQDVEVEKHPVGIIIRSHAPPKGIRFKMSREHWKAEPAVYARLPEMVIGQIEQWRNKASGKIHVEWESDGSNSDEHLSVLLRPSLCLKLLPYADNRSAPKAKGAAAKRAYAEAVARRPYAATELVEEQQVPCASSCH